MTQQKRKMFTTKCVLASLYRSERDQRKAFVMFKLLEIVIPIITSWLAFTKFDNIAGRVEPQSV